ncbi:MAG TPA: MmcQ/YjbR family DNA-binding protein [Melioribacteraceae bacterium]|nr:MmcQ/YjbR family DNA-binding protein [Melioribacteraceae bacterium]
MTLDEYRSFCLTFPFTEATFPFDETALVFKVYGKMFTLTSIDTFEIITVKAKPEAVIELCERYEGINPGYYMNKKHWVSIGTHNNISDDMIKQLITDSYNLVVKSISKKEIERWKS